MYLSEISIVFSDNIIDIYSMQTDIQLILNRVRGSGRGSVFSPVDFLDLAGRASVDQALCRLVKRGVLRRLRRGLYDYPRTSSRLGILAPSVDQIVNTIARRTGDTVRPSAAHVANMFHLTTQVPARPVFDTSGPSRTLKVGHQIIVLRHRSARQLPARATAAGNAIRALQFLGADGISQQALDRLAAKLSPRDKRDLVRAKRRVPAWLHPAIDAIARDGC